LYVGVGDMCGDAAGPVSISNIIVGKYGIYISIGFNAVAEGRSGGGHGLTGRDLEADASLG
jgi:hypothetical protein